MLVVSVVLNKILLESREVFILWQATFVVVVVVVFVFALVVLVACNITFIIFLSDGIMNATTV